MLIAAFASLNTAKAQCDLALSNLAVDAAPGIEIGAGSIIGGPGPLRCQTTFNAEFDITTNSGFKYLFFHSWLQANYPDIFTCANTTHTPNKSPGNVTQLGTSIYQSGASILDFGFIGLQLLTFPLNQEVVVTDNIAVTGEYPNNDNNSGLLVALNTAQTATITRTANNVLHFKITGIVVEVLGVCGPLKVTTDVWGSNAEVGGGNVPSKSKIGAQCYLCGQKTSLNDPTLALVGGCGNPRQFDFSIQTNVFEAIAYTYTVYFHDVLAPFDDYPVYSGTVTLSFDPTDAYPTSFGANDVIVDPATYPDFYEAANPAANWGAIRLDVTSSLFANAVSTGNLEQDCATLPVSLKSFTATRKSSSTVGLKWETAQEENSKGFYVERKLSNSGWQSISFVESKAIRGNSSSPLAYEFTDLNDAKGISQYRLRQIDIGGKEAYSQIRAVRGEGQKGKTIIYPNPSGDGKVNIVFENVNSSRDVSLMDVSGKTLKQWKGVTNNNIQIDNLNAGFYTIRIVNNETGEQVVEKFIVNKR